MTGVDNQTVITTPGVFAKSQLRARFTGKAAASIQMETLEA